MGVVLGPHMSAVVSRSGINKPGRKQEASGALHEICGLTSPLGELPPNLPHFSLLTEELHRQTW